LTTTPYFYIVVHPNPLGFAITLAVIVGEIVGQSIADNRNLAIQRKERAAPTTALYQSGTARQSGVFDPGPIQTPLQNFEKRVWKVTLASAMFFVASQLMAPIIGQAPSIFVGGMLFLISFGQGAAAALPDWWADPFEKSAIGLRAHMQDAEADARQYEILSTVRVRIKALTRLIQEEVTQGRLTDAQIVKDLARLRAFEVQLDALLPGLKAETDAKIAELKRLNQRGTIQRTFIRPRGAQPPPGPEYSNLARGVSEGRPPFGVNEARYGLFTSLSATIANLAKDVWLLPFPNALAVTFFNAITLFSSGFGYGAGWRQTNLRNAEIQVATKAFDSHQNAERSLSLLRETEGFLTEARAAIVEGRRVPEMTLPAFDQNHPPYAKKRIIRVPGGMDGVLQKKADKAAGRPEQLSWRNQWRFKWFYDLLGLHGSLLVASFFLGSVFPVAAPLTALWYFLMIANFNDQVFKHHGEWYMRQKILYNKRWYVEQFEMEQLAISDTAPRDDQFAEIERLLHEAEQAQREVREAVVDRFQREVAAGESPPPTPPPAHHFRHWKHYPGQRVLHTGPNHPYGVLLRGPDRMGVRRLVALLRALPPLGRQGRWPAAFQGTDTLVEIARFVEQAGLLSKDGDGLASAAAEARYQAVNEYARTRFRVDLDDFAQFQAIRHGQPVPGLGDKANQAIAAAVDVGTVDPIRGQVSDALFAAADQGRLGIVNGQILTIVPEPGGLLRFRVGAPGAPSFLVKLRVGTPPGGRGADLTLAPDGLLRAASGAGAAAPHELVVSQSILDDQQHLVDVLEWTFNTVLANRGTRLVRLTQLWTWHGNTFEWEAAQPLAPMQGRNP
jgi:hypothetical protein